ncbi:hypothetical protein JC2156_07070 [Weissella koreensis KCTC 3621]|nr:hypothetical protein JC2156_07070 [Weissella koreensis KCTC 3621]
MIITQAQMIVNSGTNNNSNTNGNNSPINNVVNGAQTFLPNT